MFSNNTLHTRNTTAKASNSNNAGNDDFVDAPAPTPEVVAAAVKKDKEESSKHHKKRYVCRVGYCKFFFGYVNV